MDGLNLVMVERDQLSDQELARVQSAVRRSGLNLGTWADSREEARELYSQGYRTVLIGSDLKATEAAFERFADVARDPVREPAPLAEQSEAEKQESLKDWLESGKIVALGFLMTPDPQQARVLAERSNALWIDAEHGHFDPHSVSQVLEQLPEATRTVVRVADERQIETYLNLGVDGIVLPSVEDPDQAKRLVEKVKGHHPESLAVVMIETVAGVEKADEIVAVEGVDVVHMGPFDLSLSLRQPMGSPAHREAIAKVEAAASRAGVPLGG